MMPLRAAPCAAFLLLAACGSGGGGTGGGGGGGGIGGGPILPPAGPQLVHSQPAGTTFNLIGAAGDTIVYDTSVPTPSRRVRNVATGADVELQNADLTGPIAVTADSVYGRYAVKPTTNCTPSCFLRWPIAGGAPANIVLQGSAPPIEMRAKGAFVAWRTLLTNATVEIYNTQTGQIVGPIIRTGGVDIVDYDIAVVSGAVVLYYWLGSPTTSPVVNTALQRWTEAGGAEIITGANGANGLSSGLQPAYVPRVSADGDQVAYTAWTPAAGGAPASVSVVVRPTSGGTPTTIGGASSAISMRDGVAVWTENVTGAGAGATSDLKAWSVTRGTETLQTGGPHPAALLASSGFAIYGVGSAQALNTWSGSTGAKLQRTGVPGSSRFATGNWIYYLDGSSIYRVSMN